MDHGKVIEFRTPNAKRAADGGKLMNRNEALDHVKGILNNRGEDYGDAFLNFERIAVMWSVLQNRPVSVLDVAQHFIAAKQARLVESPDHLDSWIDIIGYAALAIEMLGELDEQEDND
jgi:hypothetical protein